MKHSFVGLSESPSKFKEIIEESLGSKAYSILSNKTFQEAAAFGLLEFQDNEDQQIPQMTPEEIIKFFSDCTVVHDRKFNPGKRILSKHDTHMEVPNEDMKDAYKKVFGCEIHKDPELAKFFESEQLEEVHPAFQGGKLPLTRTADGTPEKTGQSKNSLVGKKIPVSKNASTKTNYGIGRK